MKRAVAAVCLLGLICAAAARAAPDFEALGRAVVADLAAGSFDKVVERFDQKMAAGLPKEKLSATWNGLVGQVGAFKSITGARLQELPAQRLHMMELTSAFEKTNLLIRVVFNDEEKIAGLTIVPAPPAAARWIPPAYVNPAAFVERDVALGLYKLPGTLSLPIGNGPFAAVVLVHGSGPHDRDETIGPNRPFKDLAGGLASRNVAVLRYDKRSLAAPMTIRTVKEEVVDDAEAAVGLLSGEPKIRKDRILVLGHSLGGTLAPRIASGDPRVAGIVVMAGAARPIEDLFVEQTKLLTGSASKETAAVEEAAKQIRSPQLTAGMPSILGAPAAYWLDLRGYRPAEVAATLRIPIAVLQGQRDYQVTTADFELWRKALAGRPNATLKLYPNLNHLFSAGVGPSMPDEYIRPGHVDAQVIIDLAAWIQTKR